MSKNRYPTSGEYWVPMSQSGAVLPGPNPPIAHTQDARPNSNAPPPAVDAGNRIGVVYEDEDTTRFLRRYNWTGNGVSGMSVKLFSCVLAIVSFVLALCPYGTTASGVLLATSFLQTLVAGIMLCAFAVLLLISIMEYHFSADKNHIRTVDEDYTRTEDRRFAIFYTFLGTCSYGLVTYLNLLWLIDNWSVDTRPELISSTGKFISEPFAGVAAASSVISLFVSMAFVTMLYSNIMSRLNRSILLHSNGES